MFFHCGRKRIMHSDGFISLPSTSVHHKTLLALTALHCRRLQQFLFWTLVRDASSTEFYGEIGTSVNGWNWDTGTCGRLLNPRSNERWNRSPFWWLQHPAGDSGRSSFTARLECNKEISDGLELRLVKVVSIQWLQWAKLDSDMFPWDFSLEDL